MIIDVHAMFYSSATQELKAFLRDKLELKATENKLCCIYLPKCMQLQQSVIE